jgi:hypothetical protein
MPRGQIQWIALCDHKISRLRLESDIFPSDLPIKTLCAFFHLSRTRYMHRQSQVT